jgi:hypothetical protein
MQVSCFYFKLKKFKFKNFMENLRKNITFNFSRSNKYHMLYKEGEVLP